MAKEQPLHIQFRIKPGTVQFEALKKVKPPHSARILGMMEVAIAIERMYKIVSALPPGQLDLLVRTDSSHGSPAIGAAVEAPPVPGHQASGHVDRQQVQSGAIDDDIFNDVMGHRVFAPGNT
jgi:hypothetical protein